MVIDWTKFDTSFLLEIIMASDLPEKSKLAAKEFSDDKEYLVNKMNRICQVPDKQFILKYRTIIEQKVLKYQKAEVTKICRALNILANSSNEKQIKMTKKATSASLIRAYITALYNISGSDVELTEFSKFKSTVAINMNETPIEEVPLYDFQKDAIEKLKNHFIENDRSAGIMVMPTGSGKSRTSTYYLIKEMISQGYQVLWIAHRHMLLDQAADCFYKFAGLAKINNPGIRNYNISCISGEHMNIKQVGKSEIIVASIASICRSKPHLRRILGNKVMIVVDEAHHSLAPTYKDTIEFIKKCRKNTKVLGITATPIRANEKDSQKLLEIFDKTIIYNIAMSDLIAKGILADPHFKRIDTGEDFEPEITIDEEKLLKRYGELPETLINKIASSNSRNELILNEYLNNKEVYGKTLIFAMNVLHCRFLYEELTKVGVRAGVVYSGKEDNTEVINMFKENKLDVLVNVNIMTEGTDVPDIKTVFLTRPTSSEGFLMQMIGRGMRGTKAQGTETVNIIDFHDKWEIFNKWLNPEWIILEEKGEEDKIPVTARPKRNYIEYEWSLCQEIYKSLRFKAIEANYSLSIPVGWYTLVDEEGELNRMLIFENQLQGILEMRKEKNKWVDDENITANDIIKKYFGGFCMKPSERDIKLLMDNMKDKEKEEEFMFPYILANRKSIDPYYVARKAESDNEDIFQVGEKTFEENQIVKDLYQSKEEYIMELCKAKVYKDKKHYLGLSVEELPVELIPFDRTPFYDLETLVQEVKDEMFGGEFNGISSVEWTDKAYRTYYGVHYGKDHSIKINSVLNSKNVPKEVVKFVIYHELLHRDNMSHDKEFKLKEHEYPNYAEWEHFLEDNMMKFEISEW